MLQHRQICSNFRAPRALPASRRCSAVTRLQAQRSEAIMASEVLTLNQQLLNAIAAGDYATYKTLCADNLTCFEPESNGHLVEGLPFHKFYFDNCPPSATVKQESPHVLNTMANPKVHMLGSDAAVVAYTRLTQKMTASGPVTVRAEETRVWQKTSAGWKHVHFHKSVTPA